MPGKEYPILIYLLYHYNTIWGLRIVFVCVCRQWLEDAMKENDPSSVLLFLVGTKKDLSVGETNQKWVN